MERVDIKIGPLIFDHADFDTDNDVLYLHVGAPQPAEGEETPEEHAVRYAPGTSRIVGLTVFGARRLLERDGHLAVTVPETVETTAADSSRQRLKRLDTLIGKLGRERGNVTQMQDVAGVRAVLPSLRHVYVVRRRLLKSWVIVRERDYIAEPKSSGYRALHLIVRRMGYPIEVSCGRLGRTYGPTRWRKPGGRLA